MSYLLDTNACIRYLNGRSNQLKSRIDSAGDDRIFVCSVVEAELFFGAEKSTDPAKTLTGKPIVIKSIGEIPQAHSRPVAGMRHGLADDRRNVAATLVEFR
jgi:tRNA(fMet)-specific endonuclease VapC